MHTDWDGIGWTIGEFVGAGAVFVGDFWLGGEDGVIGCGDCSAGICTGDVSIAFG